MTRVIFTSLCSNLVIEFMLLYVLYSIYKYIHVLFRCSMDALPCTEQPLKAVEPRCCLSCWSGERTLTSPAMYLSRTLRFTYIQPIVAFEHHRQSDLILDLSAFTISPAPRTYILTYIYSSSGKFAFSVMPIRIYFEGFASCLLYTSDAADE